MLLSLLVNVSLIIDLGSAYGIAKSGVSIASVGICKPEAIMKSLVPVIMAGILGIYGLIMSVILIQRSKIVYSFSWLWRQLWL